MNEQELDDYGMVVGALDWVGNLLDPEFRAQVDQAVKARGFNSVRELANILRRDGITL